MKFREHRGSLAASMATAVELPDRAALIRHCRAILAQYRFRFADRALHVMEYFPKRDPNIDWKRQSIVIIEDYGVMGFTDCLPDYDSRDTNK